MEKEVSLIGLDDTWVGAKMHCRAFCGGRVTGEGSSSRIRSVVLLEIAYDIDNLSYVKNYALGWTVPIHE